MHSWVFDTEGNRLDRYDTTDGRIAITVTLSGKGTRTTADVEAWYWRHVGWWQADPEHPALAYGHEL
jgi:hypothetical protein